MASRIPSRLLRQLPRQPRSLPLRWPAPRVYSTEAPPPPLLAKLKGDLKTAMRAKDQARLSVLRSVLAATLNASKTSTPIVTDVQLVALIKKTARASQDAVEEFRTAGRQDLVDAEEEQIRVLEEYAAGSGVQSLAEAELRAVVQPVITGLLGEGVSAKAAIGTAMKRLLSQGGPLEGKSFDKAVLMGVIKEAAEAK
ncbi:Yqey-like protein-domain-containing protein [Podospora aff. communis PSN243]|uniref:Altered inheritance of mitochondria protein 41 n=1 Tax=Podospora aff. communis PSN243 TaxID=3040156 RepID=A0AAV9GRT9_9PEZI|nr:Yqey-like protein-domain-containing protein [Podospora aff. communis PSN243]